MLRLFSPLLVLLAAAPIAAQQVPTKATRGWAIQADGRIKPLDTFAREEITAITGAPAFDGLSALDIMWGYHLVPEQFRQRPYLRIDSLELKAKLGLDPDHKRYSFDVLMQQETLRQLVEPTLKKKTRGQELDLLERDALAAYRTMERVADLISGAALTVVPLLQPDGRWSDPEAARKAEDPRPRAAFESLARLATAYREGRAGDFAAAAADTQRLLREVDPVVYPAQAVLDRELLFNDANLFGKAWVLYLLGFLTLLLFGSATRRRGYAAGLTLLGLGLACHSAGFGLRWAIAGRAPVADMYESLVFLALGVVGIGMLLEAIYRRRHFALVAGLMGALALMFAEHLPLDAAINPLVPVLAHTSWLSIHVMTIILSYSAFALTMALGHVVIGMQLFRPGKTEQLRSLSVLLYKALQVGLLFLAAGIVFGAIWANESWGRYWGWDPKETWSLITLFVYLAIVHARFAGWLHNFGLAVAAIAGFLSVLMTYYGVNFLLGAGLHTYGFASGGAFWVALYVVVEVGAIALAAVRYRAAVRRGTIVLGAAL